MTKPKPLPSQERLQELFEYSVTTGLLYRRQRAGKFSQGSAVGVRASTGYLNVWVDSHRFKAHRLIWKLVTGSEPSSDIDHYDRDRTNNAWHNLRSATRSQNLHNKTISSLKLKGAFWDKTRKKWMAAISVNGSICNLGRYDTPEEAHAAYVEAAERLHGEFARVE